MPEGKLEHRTGSSNITTDEIVKIPILLKTHFSFLSSGAIPVIAATFLVSCSRLLQVAEGDDNE